MLKWATLLSVLFSLNTQARALPPEGWDTFSDPENFDSSMVFNFSNLPTNGSLRDGKHLWSGSYWPNTEGSITTRYSKPSEEILKSELTLKVIKSYSPAEKWDLLHSRYDYTFTKTVAERFKDKSKYWAGLCNGWAAASIQHSEPKEFTIKNKEGYQIVFYPSDIKALLSYFYFDYNTKKFIGSTCKTAVPDKLYIGEVTNKACDDTNAGSFHLALTNMIGLQKKGIVADVKRDHEVWNHPMIDFTTTNKGEYGFDYPRKHPSAVKHLSIETTITYASENEPTVQQSLGTENQAEFQQTYQYIIELDQDNQIVGGEWISWARPDFIWMSEKLTPTGEWEKLNTLLKLSGASI